MPFLIIFFAGLFFVAAWQNRVSYLTDGLTTDLPPFGKFALMIAVLWAIGLIPYMRKVSTGLIALVIVSIVLTRSQQFWDNLKNIGGTAQAQAAVQPVSATLQPGNVNSGGGGGGGSGGLSVGFGGLDLGTIGGFFGGLF